jgi:hypothetical protein
MAKTLGAKLDVVCRMEAPPRMALGYNRFR